MAKTKKLPAHAEARVKAGWPWPTFQACGGVEFVKDEWRPVPDNRIAEAYSETNREHLDVQAVDLETRAKEAEADAKAQRKATGKKDDEGKSESKGKGEPVIEPDALKTASEFGLDLSVREGPGAVVPNRSNKITQKIALNAAKALAVEWGCTLEALRAAVANEVKLESVAASGEDGIITEEDVLAALG